MRWGEVGDSVDRFLTKLSGHHSEDINLHSHQYEILNSNCNQPPGVLQMTSNYLTK
jgi:hypothetical protein